MKISYNWLKKHINIDIDAEKLSALLTDCGLEVEALEEVSAIKGGLKGIVVGLVVHKEKHPDAERLSLTKVDIGTGQLLDIVCGASNVAAGQKVLVATLGAKLFFNDGAIEIKKSKIRGYVSEGMICAEDELGLGTSHDGIMVLPDVAVVGTQASTYFNLETDWVFEIGITPNRADATSHIGVARDVLALLKNRTLPDINQNIDLKLIVDELPDLDTHQKGLTIDIVLEDPEACPRYTGITVTDVTVKESPDWLKNKLKALGLKPINNIVDISNYVLFDLGQPLHIFDADKIEGQAVVVKKYTTSFEFIALDGSTQKLSADDLMICNTKEPMCIAGIYGGLNSGVTLQTKNIFIESACFSPVTIRRTSKRLGLKTDASFRFERGTDPNMTVRALKLAVKMIRELAGGNVTSHIIDKYPIPVPHKNITLNLQKVESVVGKAIDTLCIKNILRDLEIQILNEDDENLYLSVPPYRVDVTREIDIIEDILRIYGYNNVEMPNQIKVSLSFTQHPDKEKIIDNVCTFLSNNGYNEIMCNSLSKSDYYEKLPFFNKEQSVKLLNPLSKDLETLRQTLLYSGLEAITYNHNRKNFNLKLYEHGKTYRYVAEASGLKKYDENYCLAFFQTGSPFNETWAKKEEAYNFFSLKADVFNLLKTTGVGMRMLKLNPEAKPYFTEGVSYYYKKQELLSIGTLQTELLKYFDIKYAVYYAEINISCLIDIISDISFRYKEVQKFPTMRRDLALLIDENITFDQIEKSARGINNALLKDIALFDIYRGEKIDNSKKSYAVSFTFQDSQRTLTDEEIDKIMSQIIDVLAKSTGATIR